jgi:predicted nucleic acid-binding protein
VICDTSGILSAFSADQPYHEQCAEALRRDSRRLISPVVLTEIDYLAGKLLGQRAAIEILRRLSGPEYQILPYTSGTLATAAEVMTTYADLDLGLVDASLIAHSRDQDTDDILTLDQRHFRVVRSLSGRPFRILPFDAEGEPE